MWPIAATTRLWNKRFVLEDSELIEVILKGSMDHYATLVKRYQARLQSVLGYYCTNMTDVEYYAHEAFVKAYRKLDKFKPSYKQYTSIVQKLDGRYGHFFCKL